MTHRERVQAVLEGKRPDVIPVYRETGMDETADRAYLPPATGDAYRDAVAKAETYGNAALGTIIDIETETIECDQEHRIRRYETGAICEEHFDRYLYPWLKTLGALCDDYGATLHLHSHGHIEDLMDRLIAAGVDMVDPIGPGDNNDLAMFKEKWGDRITIIGGLSKTIDDMAEAEMEAHIADVMALGCPGGRFMPEVESSLPLMPREKFEFFRETLTRYCKKYGTG